MFEGVNQVTTNQMSLHTEPGCNQASPNQTSTLHNNGDCSAESNNNQGCTVTDPSFSSYGIGFFTAGGGQFVTEFAEDGIRCVREVFYVMNDLSNLLVCLVLSTWFFSVSPHDFRNTCQPFTELLSVACPE
jgi:hypothetical protein